MNQILSFDKVAFQAQVSTKEEAIRLAGQLLVNAGHVQPDYIEKMLERERTLTTYMGNGIAIPHGTNESKKLIESTGISIVHVPDGVDFGEGNLARLIIGIAAIGDEHLEILTNIALICSEDETLDPILNAPNANEILRLFEKGMSE